ncbi:MAG: hypothetical protein V4614_15070 [Pseudomonadota bacterium]
MSRAHAGFGGMGNVEESGGSGGLGTLFWFAVVGVAAGWIYSFIYNNDHDKKIAADGCMIVGGLVGAFVAPLVIAMLR